MSTLISILCVIGVFALAAAFAFFVDKKRTDQFKQVARDLGFEFVPQVYWSFNTKVRAADTALFQSLKRFHLFCISGSSKRLWNLLRGKCNNLEVAIFDYYTAGTSPRSKAFQTSVVCFRFEGPELPNFSLRPKNDWHKIWSWFGYQDIDFASHPIFSSNYLLRGNDENAIRMLFTAPVLEFYEQNPGLSTEGSGNILLFYRFDVEVRPQGIRSFMEVGLKVLSLYHSAA